MSTLSLGARVVRTMWRLAPQKVLSDVIGWGSRRMLPSAMEAAALRSFAKRYRIDLSEAELPVERYPSLQALFTRNLKSGARPVASAPDAVVAVSDGVVCDSGLVSAGKLLEAKGSAFTLLDLLADPQLAARLEGGPYLVTYLSPRDYHRVHAPVSGRIVGWTHVPGRLFPVGPRSVAREPALFARNERLVIVMDSEAGPVAVVMVAAVGVGHITASFDDEVATHAARPGKRAVRRKVLPEPIPIARGQELGVFNLGSTTIVVCAPGRVVLDSLAAGSVQRMGASIGRIIVSSTMTGIA